MRILGIDIGGRERERRELARRRLFIDFYTFPSALRDRIKQAAPAISDMDARLAIEGMRAWFLACLYADRRVLGMPSVAVDTAWHEFILFTREYQAFCDGAFGFYLHHTPGPSMGEPMGIALARTLAVIDRHGPFEPPGRFDQPVPFLFALDTEIGFPDGSTWTVPELAGMRDRSPSRGSGGSSGCSGGDGGSDGDGGSCGGGCGGGD